MDKIFLNREFEKFWQKIENNENFALLSYGDGERAIMCGEHVKAQEGWESPAYLSKLGGVLLKTLTIDTDNFYYGISCPCCDRKAYYWYMTRIQSRNITFANLWVNGNYLKFYSRFKELKREAVLIANYRAKNCRIGNLKIVKHYEVGDDCISFWEEKGTQLLENIKNEFGNKNNLLYVVAAGPMSEPIIAELYKNNPDNCYIDFGSSIDTFIHGKITRPYMKGKSKYAHLNCWMYNPVKANFDVSVVLNLYKRPKNLPLQVKSIESQSLKPKEIILYQDGTGDAVKIPTEIESKLDFIKIGKENKGVWERFKFADTYAKSEYVCIFDDDTIPGERWLENCHAEMMEREGLYGAVGVISKNKRYNDAMAFKVGWIKDTPETTRVDFVGHSWFCKKKWLKYLFEGTEELQKSKTCGEDMTFSYKLQEHNINTYVPPQPSSNKELNGSLLGISLGTDENALSRNNGWAPMSEMFEVLVGKYNFKTLQELDHNLYHSIVYKNKNRLFYIEKFEKRKVIYLFGFQFSAKRRGKLKDVIRRWFTHCD